MKYVGVIVGILMASSALAGSDDEIIASMFSSSPPPFCEYGSYNQPVQIGGDCNDDGCSIDWGSFIDSFGYLRAESGSYQSRDSVTLKGDGQYGVDAGETVHFFTEDEGYLGSAEASFEGNAYFTYKALNRGIRKFWVMRWTIHSTPAVSDDSADEYFAQQYYSQYGQDYNTEYFLNNGEYPDDSELEAMGSFAGDYMCSKASVIIQDKPSLVVTHDSGIVTIKYYIDNVYSKAVREGVVPILTLTQEGNGSRYRDEVSAIDRYGRKLNSTPVNVQVYRDSVGRYWGTYKIALQSGIFDYRDNIKATISDGKYSTSRYFKGSFYKRPEDNQTQGCTWSSTPSYGNGMGGATYYEYPPIGECQYKLKIVETTPDGVTKVTYR